MATITAATLAISSNATTKTSRCVVTCKVLFTAFEMNQIKDGLKFSLSCALWGEDLGINNWLNADDFIFSYASKIFPDATPAASELATFDVTLGTNLLDEDWGTDEVYGLLTLKNLYTNVAVKKKTNVVTRSF